MLVRLLVHLPDHVFVDCSCDCMFVWLVVDVCVRPFARSCACCLCVCVRACLSVRLLACGCICLLAWLFARLLVCLCMCGCQSVYVIVLCVFVCEVACLIV